MDPTTLTNHDPDGGADHKTLSPGPSEPVFEPEVEDYCLDKPEERSILGRDDNPATSPLWSRMRDEKVAYYLAQGKTPAWISKKMGLASHSVYLRVRKPRVIRLAVKYQRDIVERAKSELYKGLGKALQVQRDNMEIHPPEGREEQASYFRKKKHELDAAQCLSEQALKFIQNDHALTKLEERYFGAKTASPGVAVQINNGIQQPTPQAMAICEIIKHFPEEQQRSIAAKLRVKIPEPEPDASAEG